MDFSEIRKNAREILNGKWETAVIFTLVYAAIEFAISLVYAILCLFPSMSLLAYVALIVISIPISYGVSATFMDIRRGKEINYLDYLKIACSNFKRAWCITGNILKKVWIYLLVYFCLILTIIVSSFGIIFSVAFTSEIFAIIGCLIILVCWAALLAVYILLIIKLYYYALAYFIAIDNPDMTAKDIVNKSESLMTGHRAEYFVLNLSFIGWAILALLTLGIGFLWLIPYISISCIIFYEKLIGRKEAKISKVVATSKDDKLEIANSPEALPEKLEDTNIAENSSTIEISDESGVKPEDITNTDEINQSEDEESISENIDVPSDSQELNSSEIVDDLDKENNDTNK